MSQVQRTETKTAILSRADKALSGIVELFSSQEFPGYCAKALINAPAKPCSKWSLGNQLIMLLNGTTDARGFAQWREVNRYVKQGTRAFYILRPNYRTVEKEDEITKLKIKIKVLDNWAPFLDTAVHRFEDTDGKELEAYQPRSIPPLLDVAKKWGLNIRYDRIAPGTLGVMNHDTKTLTLATEDIDVFFHELAHAAHNTFEKKTTPGQDIERETIAQLSACVLSRIYGFDDLAFTWHYIGGYVGEKSPKAIGAMCLRVLAKVQKIVNLILTEAAAAPVETLTEAS